MNTWHRIIAIALAAACPLGTLPLHAQETPDQPGGSAPEDLNALIVALPKIRSSDGKPDVDVHLNSDFNCRHDQFSPSTAAAPLGCSFTDTSAGFSFRDVLATDFGSFHSDIDVSRSTSGALVLDRQLRGVRAGLNADTIVSNLALGGSILGNAIEFDGKLSWSRSWDVPVAVSLLDPQRLNETNGAASQLKVKARILDTPSVRWSIEGKTSQMDEGYRPHRAIVRNRLLAAQGNSSSVATSLTIDGWRFKASARSNDMPYLGSESTTLSAGRSGITVRGSRRVSEVRQNSLLPIDTLSRSVKSRLAVDFEMHSLLPQIAADDAGWNSLLPKLLTIETTRTEKRRPGSLDGELSIRSATGGQAYWSTPLGDTLLDLRLESQSGSRHSDAGESLFIFANHSFKLNDWSIDLDYFTSRDDYSRGHSGSDSTRLSSYGITARYAVKDMPKIEFKLGRDNLGLEFGRGDLRLRDQSLGAQAEIDFTPWLRKELERDDIQLKIELQYDFDRNSYQLMLLDEVIDSDFDQAQTRGVMVSLSMQLP